MAVAAPLTPQTGRRDTVPRRPDRRSRRILLLVVPMVLVFAIGFAAPLYYVLRFSFDRFEPGTGQIPAWSLDQFTTIFTSPIYIELILRTLGFALATTIVSAIIGYPLALALVRGPRALRPVLFAIVTMPMLTSVVVKTFGWTILLSDTGVVVSALRSVGLDVQLLFAPAGVVIGLVHTYFPFMVLSLVAAVSAIDSRTEEAARSLGSPPMQVFRRITFPQTLDGLAAGSALTFVTSMSALVTPQLLGGGQVSTIVTVIYTQATAGQNWPLASALGMVLLLITLVIVSFQAWGVRRAIRS